MDRVVETLDGFERALEGASPADVVFIPGDVRIDATGVSEIDVGADSVVLASDRGVDGSEGAEIIANDYASVNTRSVITSANNDIRVTDSDGAGRRLIGSRRAITTPKRAVVLYAKTHLGPGELASRVEQFREGPEPLDRSLTPGSVE